MFFCDLFSKKQARKHRIKINLYASPALVKTLPEAHPGASRSHTYTSAYLTLGAHSFYPNS